MATNAMATPKRTWWTAVEVGLWALQIYAAYEFLQAGSGKLLSAPMMVAAFGKIGLGQWFRYFTGTIEVVSAVGLLVPRVAGYAAAALAVVMLGAIATHLFVLGGSPALPAFLLVAMLIVCWGRLGRKMA
jgi:uncharacterized membrane protein YphA (DoxX/SURF4 family)